MVTLSLNEMAAETRHHKEGEKPMILTRESHRHHENFRQASQNDTFTLNYDGNISLYFSKIAVLKL